MIFTEKKQDENEVAILEATKEVINILFPDLPKGQEKYLIKSWLQIITENRPISN